MHKYITVAYELYADNAKGIHELIEKAPAEHPYQFISGIGVSLEAFEEKIAPSPRAKNSTSRSA